MTNQLRSSKSMVFLVRLFTLLIIVLPIVLKISDSKVNNLLHLVKNSSDIIIAHLVSLDTTDFINHQNQRIQTAVWKFKMKQHLKGTITNSANELDSVVIVTGKRRIQNNYGFGKNKNQNQTTLSLITPDAFTIESKAPIILFLKKSKTFPGFWYLYELEGVVEAQDSQINTLKLLISK